MKSYQKGDFFKTLQLYQSQFEIAIDMETNINGHIFIQTKFCVKGWEHNFFLNNKYDKLLSFLC